MNAAPTIAHRGVTQEEAQRYHSLAAEDTRISQFLDDHGVTEVHVFPYPDFPEVVVILALLDAPTPLSTWPSDTAGEVCTDGDFPPDPEITAVVWTGESGQLGVGVAPRFGDLDCAGSIPIPQT